MHQQERVTQSCCIARTATPEPLYDPCESMKASELKTCWSHAAAYALLSTRHQPAVSAGVEALRSNSAAFES